MNAAQKSLTTYFFSLISVETGQQVDQPTQIVEIFNNKGEWLPNFQYYSSQKSLFKVGQTKITNGNLSYYFIQHIAIRIGLVNMKTVD